MKCETCIHYHVCLKHEECKYYEPSNPAVNSRYAFDRGYKKGYENAKTKYIEKFEKSIRTKKEYYSNGWMCSISESVQGEGICEDILKYLEKLKEGEAE